MEGAEPSEADENFWAARVTLKKEKKGKKGARGESNEKSCLVNLGTGREVGYGEMCRQGKIPGLLDIYREEPGVQTPSVGQHPSPGLGGGEVGEKKTCCKRRRGSTRKERRNRKRIKVKGWKRKNPHIRDAGGEKNWTNTDRKVAK